jgi:hypothetical protein
LPQGTLEFDYVTWKRGLEASFRLDLSNPCDVFIGEKLISRAQASESSGDIEGAEELRECKLNEEPFDVSSALPPQGTLQVVYFSTLQQDSISFEVELDLSHANGRAILLRLWERALTTPTDFWASCSHKGEDVTYDDWSYPKVPEEGTVTLVYCVRLAIKPYDRGVFFSQPMASVPFHALANTLAGNGLHKCSDFDKVNLIKQAAVRNYFTSSQVKALVDTVSYRKGKIEAAVLLHPRTTDQNNFPHALRSLDKDSDRHDILDMVGGSIKRKTRKALSQSRALTHSLSALGAGADRAAVAAVPEQAAV